MSKFQIYWNIIKPLGYYALVGVVVFMAIGLSLSIPVCLLWNWLMPYIFGLPTINLVQAFGLSILITLLSPKEIKLNNKQKEKKQPSYNSEVEDKLEDLLKDLSQQFRA